MKSGIPWNLRGVDEETREAVVEAARRSGLSVGEWLNQALAGDGPGYDEPEEAAAIDPAAGAASGDGDARELAETIESLARRLGTMDDRARASIPGLKDRLDDIEREVSRLAALEVRADRTRAIRNVLAAVDTINRDIDTSDERARSTIEGLRVRAPIAATVPADDDRHVRDVISDLDHRIAAMAERVANTAAEPRQMPFDDIRNKLDALLARQPRPAPQPEAAAQASLLDAALRALEHRIEDAKSQLEEKLSQAESQRAAQQPPVATAEQIERIEARLAEIGERLAASEERQKPAREAQLAAAIREISAHQRTIDDRAETLAMRRDQKALAAAMGALRTDLGAINEQVNAINRLGAEGHGALFDLARRIDTIAAEQPVDRDFLAAIRDDLDAMRHLVEGTAERQLHGIAAHFDDNIRRTAPDRQKLEALGDEVSALRRMLEADDSPRALQRLEMRVSELGRSVEAVLAVRQSATGEVLADGVEARLQDIAAQLGELRDGGRTPMIDGIEARLEERLNEITSRLGGFMDSGAPAVIETVQRQIEDHIEEATLALHERLQAITDRIDALSADQREPAATLDVIKSEIGALRAEIAVKPAGDAPDTAHLESQIRDLASQLETVAGSKTEGVALANLEAQVAQLASELEQTRPGSTSLAEVEESLAHLQSLLGDNAKESIAAARSEARKVVGELSGMMAGNDVDAEVVHGLMQDLDSLRQAAGASDSETRARLESVSDTLAQVVDRLSQLETSAIRDTAPPATAPAATPAIVRMEPRELLWKSGFRPAADIAPKSLATVPTVPDTGEKKPTDRRADFIAAARRAAQAAQKEVASIESAAAEAEMAEPVRAGAERRPGAFARISQAIRSRKRPLLLAAAAIVLAVGAMQVYGKVLPKITPLLTADASIVAPAADEPPTAKAAPRVIAPATASEAVQTPVVPAASRSALVAPSTGPDTALAFAEPENLDNLDAGHFGTGTTAPNPTTFQTASQAADSDGPVSTGQDSATASAPVNLSGASADDINPVMLASAEVPSATGLDSRLGSDRLLSAASGGDPAAEFEIATRYADGTRVSKNLAKAAEWYAKAAEGGVAVAQYRLGSLYERGQGVTKNLVNAVDWYQRAADQGNVNAMHNLAVLMSEGVDGPPDHDKALQWFLAAGNYGVRDSQYNLGVIYARGLGVTADLAESYKWFAIAAAQGDTDASARRDEVAKTLSPDDLTKARASVSAWHVKAPIAEANGVAAPAGGWDGPAQMIGEADRQALVKKIQTLLADQGFDPGPADGVAGKKTVEAVRAYQRKVGAPETGQIDNVLVASLSEVNQ